MDSIKLYFVMFSVHSGKEWTAHAGYVFTEVKEDLTKLLNEKYGEVFVRYAEEIDIYPGKILYGERWVNE